MNKTQAGRLLTLAYFLKTEVPSKQFNMKWYGRREPEQKPVCLGECGTSACALGWATEVFPEVFRMEWPGGLLAVVCMCGVPWAVTWESPEVWKFFGVDCEESLRLFGRVLSTPEQKAKQIEALVESYGYTYAD